MPIPGWVRIAGWAVTIGAVAVYLIMVTVTLPHLAMLAGQLVFDLRPGGYDLDTARAILTGLGAEGRAYYAGVQHAFDMAFPVLLGLTVAYWMWRAARHWRDVGLRMAPIVFGILTGFAFLAAAFDLAENGLVSEMLVTGPEALTESLVGAASSMTIAKSAASTIAFSALLVLGVVPLVAGWLRKREGQS